MQPKLVDLIKRHFDVCLCAFLSLALDPKGSQEYLLISIPIFIIVIS